MTTAAHFFGFALTTLLWLTFWIYAEFGQKTDFTAIPPPGQEWRSFMVFCTLVGICFVLLAYR